MSRAGMWADKFAQALATVLFSPVFVVLYFQRRQEERMFKETILQRRA
jgi:hypothetical protein